MSKKSNFDEIQNQSVLVVLKNECLTEILGGANSEEARVRVGGQ